MRHRFCWLKAVFYVSIATVTVSYAYSDDDFSGNKKLKHIALEYGEVLTSLENGEILLKSDRSSMAKLSQRSSSVGSPTPTRCTTGASITLDPTFDPSSSEKQNGIVPELPEQENTSSINENVMSDGSGTTARGKEYKPPPEAKQPDHYIDDP